jgi:hypothetical protein
MDLIEVIFEEIQNNYIDFQYYQILERVSLTMLIFVEQIVARKSVERL